MKNRRNYYRILQVQPDAPLEIIRASYRASMLELKLHPDLGGSPDTAALLNEAFAVLSDSGRRKAYDRELNIAGLREPRRRVPAPKEEAFFRCRFCRTPAKDEPSPGEHCGVCGSPLISAPIAEFAAIGRRSFARFTREEKLRYYTRWPQKWREGRLLDLSPKGMRFLCADDLPSGALVKISSPLLEAVASVTNVRCEPAPKRMAYSVGVVFLTVTFDHTKGTFLSANA
jgi:hypothetical protein